NRDDIVFPELRVFLPPLGRVRRQLDGHDEPGGIRWVQPLDVRAAGIRRRAQPSRSPYQPVQPHPRPEAITAWQVDVPLYVHEIASPAQGDGVRYDGITVLDRKRRHQDAPPYLGISAHRITDRHGGESHIDDGSRR